MVIHIQFSESRIALQQEVKEHPELLKILQEAQEKGDIPPDAFTDRLAMVAGYCEVIVDGYYHDKELDHLCDILIKKLKAKRVVIITSPSPGRIQ